MAPTTQTGQLSKESTAWIDSLRLFRDKFVLLKSRLQQIADNQINREALIETEQFQNQFHIQLINIHDLKQAIKKHHRNINAQETSNEVYVTDDLLAKHENFSKDYQSLENTLTAIDNRFSRFNSRIRKGVFHQNFLWGNKP